ncbi:hypothetical protein B0H63DRAFT_490831, partial [Podospora didyma]
ASPASSKLTKLARGSPKLCYRQADIPIAELSDKFRAANASKEAQDIAQTSKPSKSSSFPEASDKAVATGCWPAPPVFLAIVVFGGLTRLSITEWKPWESEFEKYRASPEFKLINPHMDLSDFKRIYFMEWTIVFWTERRPLAPGSHPRVSQYRLATHLAAAFVCYSWMLLAGLKVLRTHKALLTILRVLRGSITGLTALIFTTVLSAPWLQDLTRDSSTMIYSRWAKASFPRSRSCWNRSTAAKEDGSDLWWRNMLENPSLVQLDHRILAMTTFTAVMALFFYSRTARVKGALPKDVRKGVNGLVHLSPLAAAHQAGALALLTGVLVAGQTPAGTSQYHGLGERRLQVDKVIESGINRV